jgi:hypothetical protein
MNQTQKTTRMFPIAGALVVRNEAVLEDGDDANRGMNEGEVYRLEVTAVPARFCYRFTTWDDSRPMKWGREGESMLCQMIETKS